MKQRQVELVEQYSNVAYRGLSQSIKATVVLRTP